MGTPTKKEEDEALIPTTVRFTRAELDRIEECRARMEKRLPGAHISSANALHAILAQGLKAFEATK
jgi:hypothetical protein